MERRIEVVNRRGLVHWFAEEGTYFVTFRLADSLPRFVMRERKRSVVEEFLDRGYGAAHLKNPEIAEVVYDTINRLHGDRYFLHSQCVMPTHVHSVLRTAPGVSLTSVMHSWKSVTANRANAILRRTGPFWEREWFDSLIRDERGLARANAYVLANPEKAGLQHWPWVAKYDTPFEVKYEYRPW